MDSYNQPTTNPGASNPTWQLVIHRSMNELDWLCIYLKEKCIKYAAREHDPDEGCERNHCHFAIQYPHTKQALTKFLNTNDIKGSDNFGILTVVEKTKEPYDFDKLSIYIMKGIVDATVRYSGVTAEFIEECRVSWNANKPTQSVRAKDKYNEWDEIKSQGFSHFVSYSYTLEIVSKYVMRFYWKRDGRFPQANVYKRNAASLYYALVERDQPNRCLSTAMDELMEKFY